MTYEQILSEIHKKNFAPVYFLAGEEPYFIDMISDSIENEALDEADRAFNQIVVYGRDYWTGTVYTTNRRVWEHDEEFKDYLRKIRCMGVDMETATIFSVGFHNEIPTGALLLVSDNPMVPEGVKTEESDKQVSKNYVGEHLRIGIDSLRQLINNGITVKHLKF